MRVSDYDLLFDLPEGEYDGGKIGGVRTVTIRAGRSLEVMCHPIVRISAEAKREAKARRSTPAMERLNARNTERHIMRLIEENFTPEAVVVTGTYAYPMEDYGMCDLEEMAGIYDRRGLPWDVDRIRMDIRNWREKLKRRVLAVGGTTKDLKWIVRIEEGKEPPGVGLPPKYHFHAIVEGPGLDSETVKALWAARRGWRGIVASNGAAGAGGAIAGTSARPCRGSATGKCRGGGWAGSPQTSSGTGRPYWKHCIRDIRWSSCRT